MKRRLGSSILLLAAVFVMASCGSSEKSVVPVVENPFVGATVGTDSTLEIATWNLENFAKAHDETVAKVSQAVAAMDIDIIALQEIKNGVEFQALVDGLEGWEGRKASTHCCINLAYLYRTGGKLEVDSFYEILAGLPWKDPLDRNPFVLSGSYDGKPIVVINNHYWARGDGIIDENDPEDREWLRLQASRLLDEYIRTNYAGQRVILVGDLNDQLTDSAANNVFQPFLDAPDLYDFVDMDIARGPSSGWSYPNWPSHLDHILITAPLFEAFQGSTTLVQVVPLHTFLRQGFNDYEEYISDHLPVVLKLEL
ncbi:MAG: endonuclease/exonuclease/phosphatase family protein [Candidatus Krumholzibacteriota bacterium]